MITQKAMRAVYNFFCFKNISVLKKGSISSKVLLEILTCELYRK